MKMFQSLAQVTAGVLDRSFCRACRFPMWLQRAQHLWRLSRKQPTLLFPKPQASFARTSDLGGGGGQIFTDMIKVDEIPALRAEVVFEPFHDPGRAIAYSMNKRSLIQSATQRRLTPKQRHIFQRAQSGSVESACLAVGASAA